MKISRENYEICFIEYFDGKLNPVDTAELMLFLHENRDLEEEFNSFSKVSISDPEINFREKDLLKKELNDLSEINNSNFEEFCIASLEGDIDGKSKRKLDEFLLNNPGKYPDYLLFGKTKLYADKSIVFQDHKLLKKQKNIVLNYKRIIYSTAFAASVLFAIFMLTKKSSVPDIKTANQDIKNPEVTNQNKLPENEITQLKSLKIAGAVKQEVNNDKKVQIILTEPENKPVRHKQFELQQINPLEVTSLAFKTPEPKSIEKILERDPDFSYAQITKEIPEEKEFELIPETPLVNDKLSLWTLAEAGIKGVNYLTESDFTLQKITTEKGEKIEFNLNSEKFRFSTYRKNNR